MRNLGNQPGRKLILIFLIFMSLGENLFLSSFSPDSGAACTDSDVVAFRLLDLDRRLVRLGSCST